MDALPSLSGANGWLNSPPLTAEGLRGRVVLVDFWTFTCVNWLRTLPYLRAWDARYRERGLTIVGVHTPEFDVEHGIDDVRRAVESFGIGYPVAIDNDYAVWEAFENHYWPALYLADAEGSIRYRHFGEGRYDDTERAIQGLLDAPGDLVAVAPTGAEVAADLNDLDSPETYVGYARGERLASPEQVETDVPRSYSIPETLRRNEWALSGEWTVGREATVLDAPGGAVAYRFHARDVNLVLAPPNPETPVRLRVLLDGRPPGADHGADVDETGAGEVTEPRLYQLVRRHGPIGDATVEVAFSDEGVQAFVFTFG